MNRSVYTAGLKWEPGHLNDSSYRAFTKFAAKLFNTHPPSLVLKEVAALIETAGDSADKGKLVEQFASAFAFVAHERACEALGARELRAQRVEGNRAEGKWPEPEPKLIEAIARENAHHTLAAWRKRTHGSDLTPRNVLPVLFPAGSLVCFGPRKDIHWVRAMDDMLIEELAPAAQFIVPNPARSSFVPPGRRSAKCDTNFPQRRFLIIEFEAKCIALAGKRSLSEILDLQSALHWHVAERTEALALLVYSGNKSLHAWHRCENWGEAKVIELLRYVARLGADLSFQSPSQFTRMPLGRHANGTRQSVHFFKAL